MFISCVLASSDGQRVVSFEPPQEAREKLVKLGSTNEFARFPSGGKAKQMAAGNLLKKLVGSDQTSEENKSSPSGPSDGTTEIGAIKKNAAIALGAIKKNGAISLGAIKKNGAIAIGAEKKNGAVAASAKVDDAAENIAIAAINDNRAIAIGAVEKNRIIALGAIDKNADIAMNGMDIPKETAVAGLMQLKTIASHRDVSAKGETAVAAVKATTEEENRAEADASRAFAVGDRVKVRDKDTDEWQLGFVTNISPLEVKPRFYDNSFSWEHVEKDAASE